MINNEDKNNQVIYFGIKKLQNILNYYYSSHVLGYNSYLEPFDTFFFFRYIIFDNNFKDKFKLFLLEFNTSKNIIYNKRILNPIF